MKRAWSLTSRLKQSRLRRMTDELVRHTEWGVRYYELVWHLVRASPYEKTIVYEAILNNTTPEEWAARHRIDGRPTGDEVYLPRYPLLKVLIKGKKHGFVPSDLYCFLCKEDFNSYKSRRRLHPLLDNKDRVREYCREFTRKRKLELLERGHPQVWGMLRMTGQLRVYIRSSCGTDGFQPALVPCRPTGVRTVYGGVPHQQVELITGEKIFACETEVTSGTD